MNSRKRSVAAAVCLAVAATLAALLPSTSAEATSYRFWIYWTGGSGDWDFSAQGASRRPADGTVDGWRFAVSEEAASSSSPRLSSSFQQICESTDPVEGQKRVGLVIDYGTTGDAPPGESPPSGTVARCVVAPTTATGYDILVAATSIRVEEGMVCGISGYPRSGCGEAVSTPKPSDQPDSENPDGSTDGTGRNAGGSDSSEGSTTRSDGQNAKGGSDAGSPNRKSNGSQAGGSGKGGDKESRSASGGKALEESPDDSAVVAATNTALPTTPGGSRIGVLVGLAVLIALIGGATLMARRRRGDG